MSTKNIILSRLDKQDEIDGPSWETQVLRKFLAVVRTESQWRSFVSSRHRRHGKLSFQTHTFYYPKPELISLIEMDWPPRG